MPLTGESAAWFPCRQVNMYKGRYRSIWLGLMLLAGVVSQKAGNDDDDDVPPFFQSQLFQSLADKDRELIRNYLTFIRNRNPPFFVPVMIVCIVLGLLGHLVFFYFFANKSSKMYYTRDALYIRSMSFVDFLGCGVVLPYAVMFETKLVTDDLSCKVGEYFRHAFFYTTHMLLTAYSLEIVHKYNYLECRKRFKKSLLIILVVSIVFSLPTLVIFEAGEEADFYELLEENSSKVEAILQFPVSPGHAQFSYLKENNLTSDGRLKLFNPRFCHFSLRYNHVGDSFTVVRVFQMTYMLLNGLFLFLLLFVFMFKIVQYMERNPLVGLKSAYVVAIEVDHPEIVKQINQLRQIKKEEKRLNKEARLRRRTNSTNVTTSVVPHQEQNIPHKKNDDQRSGILSAIGRLSTATSEAARAVKTETSIDFGSAIELPVESAQQQAFESAVSPDVKLRSVSISQIIPDTGEGMGQRLDKPASEVGEERAPTVVGTDLSAWEEQESVSLARFLCGCECFRSHPKPVRTLYRKHRGYASFRNSLMVLVLVNLLVLAATAALVLVNQQRFYVTNLVAFKCVFGFYLLSLIHRSLRRATWGDCCRYSSDPLPKQAVHLDDTSSVIFHAVMPLSESAAPIPGPTDPTDHMSEVDPTGS